MALTQTQVSELYVAIFGRVSEGSGNKAWQNSGLGAEEAAQKMLATEPAKKYFGSSLDSNEAFVKHIYLNTLNKTQVEDPDGIKNWVDHLNSGKSREWVITKLIESAKDPVHKTLPSKDAHQFFLNKVALSDYTADKVDGKDLKVEDLTPFKDALKLVTSDPDSLVAAKQYVDALAGTPSDTSVEWNSKPAAPAGAEVALTTSDDKATANVFNAGMGWNPGGTDRMMTLQSEDKLVGDSARADNTLNVTFGKQNGDEKDPTTRTPDLKNIQNINIEVTGDVNTLDLRNSDDVEKVSIDRITAEADAGKNFTVQSIGEKLHGIRVKDSAKKNAEIKFEHKDGVLNGLEDKTSLFLDNSVAAKVTVNDEDGNDGYEKIDLVSKGSVKIGELNLVDLQNIDIKGSGSLTLADVKRDDANQFDEVTKAGLAVDNPEFFKSLDASGFAGKLAIDITDIVGAEHVDPSGSGKDTVATIKGSGLGDTFYVVDGEIKARNILDGGASGEDKLVLIDSDIATENAKNEIARVRNVETLELRAQTGTGATVDFDAFTDEDGKAETSIRKVVVRDEKYDDAAFATFTFNDVTKDFADNGKFVIEHSVEKAETDINDTTLVVNLKDNKAKDDKITVEVIDSRNLDKSFAYTINAAGVESVNIADKDSESNTLTLGTDTAGKKLEITGGKENQFYRVDHLVSDELNASEYKGDLRIQAEGKDQTIKLGNGNDIVKFNVVGGAFNKPGGLTSADKVVGNGGDDIVIGVLTGNQELDLTSVEELQIASTAVVDLDLTKSKDIKKLVFISQASVQHNDLMLGNDNKAIAGLKLDAAEVAGIKEASVVTVKGTNVTELNFSADFRKNDLEKAADATAAGKDLAHKFNGVKLDKNESKTVTLNINGALDETSFYNTTDKAVETLTADSYSTGHLTIHGAESIDIKVADDRSKIGAKAATQTTINGIFAKNLVNLTAASKGNVDLGTISANNTRDSIKLIDAEKVLGDFKANVIALGDNAEVKLGDGNNEFSADQSTGEKIKITAGNGRNIITGSEQRDIITTGDGRNDIKAGQGNNIVSVGAGDDKVTAAEGSDEVSLGKGYDTYEDNANKIEAPTAKTSVTKDAGAALITVHSGSAAGKTDIQMIAVAGDSQLFVKWNAHVLDNKSVLLDGVAALNANSAGAILTGAVTLDKGLGDNNNNLWLVEHALAANKVVGNGGNDVAIVTKTGAAINFDGGMGDDAAVGGNDNDQFFGGKGADVFVMQNTDTKDSKIDKIIVNAGDSLAGSHDVVYGFDVAAVTQVDYNAFAVDGNKAGGDVLDLQSTLIAGAGDIAADTVITKVLKVAAVSAKGVVTFKDGSGAVGAITEKDLGATLSMLADKLSGTAKTVAFAYDRDGDLTTTDDIDTFIFQDGDGSNDTVIQLHGIKFVAGAGLADLDAADVAANDIAIV